MKCIIRQNDSMVSRQYVGFGVKADIALTSEDVCFLTQNECSECDAKCPLLRARSLKDAL